MESAILIAAPVTASADAWTEVRQVRGDSANHARIVNSARPLAVRPYRPPPFPVAAPAMMDTKTLHAIPFIRKL